MPAKKCLLSLALIMRDAAGDILACLESVAGAVDEMIIVDTGSRDDSVKVVRKFLRKWQGEGCGRAGKVYQIPWRDDFSAAKNYALSRCSGDWVLLLDSDESISEETRANLRPLIEGLARGQAAGIKAVRLSDADAGGKLFDLLELWRKNVDSEGQAIIDDTSWDLAVRLCRRHDRLRYRGQVHEQLVWSDGRPLQVGSVAREELAVIHTGYRTGLKEEKEERNFRILLQEQARGDGQTVLLDYYLAENYLMRQQWGEALDCALKSYNGTRPAHDKIAPLRIMYQALRGQEQEALQQAGLEIGEGEPLPEARQEESPHLQEARRLRLEQEKVIAEAMAEFPLYPEFYYFRGGRKWNAGDKAGGYDDLKRAMELAEAFQDRFPEEEFTFRELMPNLRAALAQVAGEMESNT